VSKIDRDKQLFSRLRPEQIEELVYYVSQEEELITGEVVENVRNEEFTKAAMKCGELEWCRTFRDRADRFLRKDKE